MKTSVRGATHAWESTVGAAARDRNNNFVFYLKLLCRPCQMRLDATALPRLF